MPILGCDIQGLVYASTVLIFRASFPICDYEQSQTHGLDKSVQAVASLHSGGCWYNGFFMTWWYVNICTWCIPSYPHTHTSSVISPLLIITPSPAMFVCLCGFHWTSLGLFTEATVGLLLEHRWVPCQDPPLRKMSLPPPSTTNCLQSWRRTGTPPNPCSFHESLRVLTGPTFCN